MCVQLGVQESTCKDARTETDTEIFVRVQAHTHTHTHTRKCRAVRATDGAQEQ